MLEKVEISNAEWDVMRVIWALGETTSRQIIEALSDRRQWKPATTKTLIGRLVAKGYVGTRRKGRAYIYYPIIKEQQTINEQILTSFGNICQMHVGQTLATVLNNVELSKDDIKKLESILEVKAKNAPESLPCNCVPNGSCDCMMRMDN